MGQRRLFFKTHPGVCISDNKWKDNVQKPIVISPNIPRKLQTLCKRPLEGI